MNKVFIKGYKGNWSIDDMPDGCLFYSETGEVCMKVHMAEENNTDFCYYVNLRTSFLFKVSRDCMFTIVREEILVKTVWQGE